MSNKGKVSDNNSEVESSESEGENANNTLVEVQTHKGDEVKETRASKTKVNDQMATTSTARRTGRNNSKIATKHSEKLTFELVDSLTINRLKDHLKELHLSTIGKKKDLQNTLKDHIRRTEKHDDEEESDVESDHGEDENETQEEDTTEGSDDEAEEEATRRPVKITRARHRTADRNDRARDSFTIKDVEESITPFTGDDGLDVKKWIADFEDMAALLGWTDLQLLIYGKRMLRGSAKKFITYEPGIVSWKILKNRLKREFKRETNSALIHAQMAARKRLPHESGRQYVYEMQEIASQGHVEESALMQHVIDGIQDDECNKSILYSAETLHELKKKLEKYDLMKEKSSKKKPIVKKEAGRDFNSARWQTNKQVRCFSCGSSDHNVQNCNNKSRGPKCFKCNDFGHISSNCTKSSTADQRSSRVSCVTTVNTHPIIVKINGIDCAALVDTGSDVNLIRKDIHDKVGRPKLCKVSRIFTGLGNVETRPVGKFTADVIIGNDLYSTEIFVVPTNAMTSKVILGHELLKEAEVLIRGGSIVMKRLHPGTVTEGSTVEDSEDGEDQLNTAKEAGTSEEDCEIAKLSKVFYVSECEVGAEKPYKEKIEKLIKDYKPSSDVKTTVETKITLSCDNPICQQPRLLAPKEKRILNEPIQEWVESGVIRESKTQLPFQMSSLESSNSVSTKKRKLTSPSVEHRKSKLIKRTVKENSIKDTNTNVKDIQAINSNLDNSDESTTLINNTDAKEDSVNESETEISTEHVHVKVIDSSSQLKTNTTKKIKDTNSENETSIISLDSDAEIVVASSEDEDNYDVTRLSNSDTNVESAGTVTPKSKNSVEHRKNTKLTPKQLQKRIDSAKKRKEKCIHGDSTTSSQQQSSSTRKSKVPEEALPDLIRLIHGNMYGRSFLVKEFMIFWNKKGQGGEHPISKSSLLQKEHAEIVSIIEQEAIKLFDKDREGLRNIPKENILKVQEENKRYHDRKSKPATVYREGDMVAIKRTQFGSGLKIQKKFLGPYVVSQAKGNDRYEVVKVGNGEGQKITTTSADYMKLYKTYSSETEEQSGMAE